VIRQIPSIQLKFMRDETACAVDTIMETINILHDIETPDKEKVKCIINILVALTMILYADEREFIQLQRQNDELQAMFEKAQEEETIQ
jgi:hypothetical protein